MAASNYKVRFSLKTNNKGCHFISVFCRYIRTIFVSILSRSLKRKKNNVSYHQLLKKWSIPSMGGRFIKYLKILDQKWLLIGLRWFIPLSFFVMSIKCFQVYPFLKNPWFFHFNLIPTLQRTNFKYIMCTCKVLKLLWYVQVFTTHLHNWFHMLSFIIINLLRNYIYTVKQKIYI